MTLETRSPPTRSSLLRCRRRLDQVRRGTLLLRRKRQSLVDELFARARTAVTSREAIAADAREAWHAVWTALIAAGGSGLAPLGWPTREVEVELTTSELWGVRAAALTARPRLVRTLAARAALPGPAEAPGETAAAHFERLIERVLEAAPQEQAMRRLGQALARTTRLVNTLEQRVAVRLDAEISDIARTLGEREREEHLRIKRLIGRR